MKKLKEKSAKQLLKEGWRLAGYRLMYHSGDSRIVGNFGLANITKKLYVAMKYGN